LTRGWVVEPKSARLAWEGVGGLRPTSEKQEVKAHRISRTPQAGLVLGWERVGRLDIVAFGFYTRSSKTTYRIGEMMNDYTTHIVWNGRIGKALGRTSSTAPLSWVDESQAALFRHSHEARHSASEVDAGGGWEVLSVALRHI